MPIISILLLIAVIVLGVLVWWPKYQNLQDLTSESNIKTDALQQKQEYFANLGVILKRLQGDQYKDSLDKVETALPDRVSVPELFNFVQLKAAENGLVVGNMTSQDLKGQQSVGANEVQRFSFSASFTGSYTAFKNLLSTLNKNSRLIEIDSMGFSSAAGQPGAKETIFTFNLTMNIPYYQESSVVEQLPGIPGGATLP